MARSRSRRRSRKGKMPAALAAYWAKKRGSSRRKSRAKSTAPKSRRRRRTGVLRRARVNARRYVRMARRGTRRRASRRSYSGPAVSARGFTSKESLMMLGGASAGLVTAPIVSVKVADALRDEKTKLSPLDGPLQNAAIAAAVGVGGGLALRGVDKNLARGFFVGSTAGAIATGLVAYARKNKMFGLSGDEAWIIENQRRAADSTGYSDVA